MAPGSSQQRVNLYGQRLWHGGANMGDERLQLHAMKVARAHRHLPSCTPAGRVAFETLDQHPHAGRLDEYHKNTMPREFLQGIGELCVPRVRDSHGEHATRRPQHEALVPLYHFKRQDVLVACRNPTNGGERGYGSTRETIHHLFLGFPPTQEAAPKMSEEARVPMQISVPSRCAGEIKNDGKERL